jgi:2',3'-cyclic-nucleotide 2'-phosphodiesterase (5'-nucleotidase family)
MNSKKILLSIVICISLLSCSHKTWQITQATSTKIPLDASTEPLADKNYQSYLLPVKQKVDEKMNVVIGQASETMKGYAPESLLSNFTADVYRQSATEFLGEKVDISVVNLGGLRTVVNVGDITIGKIFELMPFENELVIVWLKGDKLLQLLQFFASVGGEGVSGIRMEIRNNKAINITIDGKALDTAKAYSIATNDYLAAGNDKMTQLAQNEKRVNTGIKIRDMLLNYIKNETQKGNKIQSKLDGRIRILNP